MTIDELREFPNCGHYTDEQAIHVIQTLENLAVILFDYTAKENGIIIDNQLVINENQEKCTLNTAA